MLRLRIVLFSCTSCAQQLYFLEGAVNSAFEFPLTNVKPIGVLCMSILIACILKLIYACYISSGNEYF